MTFKEFKDLTQSVPDDALVVIEGRFGELFDVNRVELVDKLDGYDTKILYLS